MTICCSAARCRPAARARARRLRRDGGGGPARRRSRRPTRPSCRRCPSRGRSSSSPSPARRERGGRAATTGGSRTGDRRAEADRPASGALERHDAPSAINGGTKNATALDNGVALPPLEAPSPVLKIIEAGNAIARTPYKWGGGHGRFLDTGYDCSGSVSFALYAAGLIEGPSDSGGLMSWGKAGPGKWVTIFSSPGHVYMEVAGIRFDTSGAQATGSRWQNDLRGDGGLRRAPSGRSLGRPR